MSRLSGFGSSTRLSMLTFWAKADDTIANRLSQMTNATTQNSNLYVNLVRRVSISRILRLDQVLQTSVSSSNPHSLKSPWRIAASIPVPPVINDARRILKKREPAKVPVPFRTSSPRRPNRREILSTQIKCPRKPRTIFTLACLW